jgi:hypothetical protein
MPVTAVFRFHKDYGVIAILPDYYGLVFNHLVTTLWIHMASDYYQRCNYEEMMRITVAAPKELYIDLLDKMQE